MSLYETNQFSKGAIALAGFGAAGAVAIFGQSAWHLHFVLALIFTICTVLLITIEE